MSAGREPVTAFRWLQLAIRNVMAVFEGQGRSEFTIDELVAEAQRRNPGLHVDHDNPVVRSIAELTIEGIEVESGWLGTFQVLVHDRESDIETALYATYVLHPEIDDGHCVRVPPAMQRILDRKAARGEHLLAETTSRMAVCRARDEERAT